MSGNLRDLANDPPLDVETIADVARIRRKPDSYNIHLHHEHLYKGVLVVEISVVSADTEEGKRVKLNNDRRRVAVLGQSIDEAGKVVFMERGRGGKNRANVTAGLNLEIIGIDKTIWCDGLAIRHVENLTAGGKVGNQAAKRPLKDARVGVVKEILRRIDDYDNYQKAWGKLDWKAVDVSTLIDWIFFHPLNTTQAYIDGFQNLLRPKNTSGASKHSKKTKVGVPFAKPSRRVATTFAKPAATTHKLVATSKQPKFRRRKDQPEKIAHNNDNSSESEATGDEHGQQVPSTPEPIDDRVPNFEANKFGLLDVKEAESAKRLMEKFMFAFRGPEAEDDEWTFVNLMNKAYPHAVFHPSIFDAFWREKGNQGSYTFLDNMPEFITWWRTAHVRPPAGKSPSVLKRLEQQAETEQLHPGFYGLCYWLVSLRNAPPEPSPEVNHHVEELDPPDVPANDDVHMEDVSTENVDLGIDWDELDAMEEL